MADRSYPLFREHWSPFVGGQYRGVVAHVVDGDTLDVLVDLGFGASVYLTVRLRNINAPEIRGVDAATRAAGEAAAQWLKDRVLNRPVLLVTHKDRRTFGRYVAEILDEEGNVGTDMVAAGHAVRVA